MKNYKKCYNRRTGKTATWDELASSLGLNSDIKEETRIKTSEGKYFVVYDLKPQNHKYPVLLKNRDGKFKGTVALVNNSEIIVYQNN